jgi:N-acylneuraminate cytidylyltransferase
MPIAGRPCVAWTIEHAMRNSRIGMVVVSSDCPTTLDIARGMGAWAIARPATLARDDARVDDAARHALSEVDHALTRLGASHTLPRFERVVILYANVPVRPQDLTDRAIELLARTGCDSVQSYEHAGKHHPWWTARIDADSGDVRPWEGRVLNHGVFRRQDLPPAFVPDGGVIALTREALEGRTRGAGDGPHAFFGRDRRGIISGTGPDGVGVVDIDAPIDAIVADAVLRMRHATSHGNGWARAC